ncbi:MAG: hypothetical protein AB1426_07505 [Bacillota bacterium]
MVSIDQLRWRTTARELKRKLGSFAQQPLFTEAAIWAQHLYLSTIAGSLLYLDDDFVSERCFEWFIFDFPISGREAVIDIFRQVAAGELNEQELELLKWWSKAPSAFYEVKESWGQVILVEDVFTGNTYCVRGFENPDDVCPGSILYLRLLRVGDEFEFSTTGLSLPGEVKETLVSWLKQDFAVYTRLSGKKKRIDWNSYLRQRAHRIIAWAAFVASNERREAAGGEEVWGERLNNLIFLLEEYIFRELIRSRIRRERWKELFGKALAEEAPESGDIKCEQKKKSPGDEVFNWPQPVYAEVARLITKDLKKRGKAEEVKKALDLWHRFCVLNRPAVRKVSAWVAAVVYTVARMQGSRLNQQRLAAEYGVSVSAVSIKHRMLCRSLGLF